MCYRPSLIAWFSRIRSIWREAASRGASALADILYTLGVVFRVAVTREDRNFKFDTDADR